MTIDTVGNRLKQTPENQRPSNVLVLVITDGRENASREYKHDAVMAKIKHQTAKYNWQFVYLGANQDSIAVGANLGVGAQFSSNYVASSQGVADMFKGVTQASLNYRGGKGYTTQK